MSKTFTGINIQWPISEKILDGSKRIETRTYPCPNHLINTDLLLIETPGKRGKFKARISAVIRIKNCYEYKNKTAFYKETHLHLITKSSEWAWKDKPKWGWEIEIIHILQEKIECHAKGIVFRRNITLKTLSPDR